MERYTKEYLESLADLDEFKVSKEARESAWTFVQAIKEDKFQFTPAYSGGIQIDMEVRAPHESYYTEVVWNPDGEQVLY